jgi:hypothetical protein
MSSKAFKHAEALRADFAQRFATVSGLISDVNGQAYFLVGAGTAGTQSCIVKVQDFVPAGFDGVGHPAASYGCPVTVQICEECSTIAATPLLTGANQAIVMGVASSIGARVELYMTANTVIVSNAAIVVGNLVATYDPSLQYKMQSSM